MNILLGVSHYCYPIYFQHTLELQLSNVKQVPLTRYKAAQRIRHSQKEHLRNMSGLKKRCKVRQLSDSKKQMTSLNQDKDSNGGTRDPPVREESSGQLGEGLSTEKHASWRQRQLTKGMSQPKEVILG